MKQTTTKPKDLTPMDKAMQKMADSRSNQEDRTAKIYSLDSERYYAPELFSKELSRRMEERRSALNVDKLTRAQINEIVQDIFLNGMQRPVVDETEKEK